MAQRLSRSVVSGTRRRIPSLPRIARDIDAVNFSTSAKLLAARGDADDGRAFGAREN
jgi:hypothetical protein